MTRSSVWGRTVAGAALGGHLALHRPRLPGYDLDRARGNPPGPWRNPKNPCEVEGGRSGAYRHPTGCWVTQHPGATLPFSDPTALELGQVQLPGGTLPFPDPTPHPPNSRPNSRPNTLTQQLTKPLGDPTPGGDPTLTKRPNTPLGDPTPGGDPTVS
ncbi:unnamed protein product [Cercospora beticola]|nr:unnamed protein product [Cercospora beticola]